MAIDVSYVIDKKKSDVFCFIVDKISNFDAWTTKHLMNEEWFLSFIFPLSCVFVLTKKLSKKAQLSNEYNALVWQWVIFKNEV